MDTVTKNLTLYAGWGAKVTKVYFKVDQNAGEVAASPDSDVDFGHRIPLPEASKAARVELPTEYTVEGWYTDEGNRWDFTKGLIDADGIFHQSGNRLYIGQCCSQMIKKLSRRYPSRKVYQTAIA